MRGVVAKRMENHTSYGHWLGYWLGYSKKNVNMQWNKVSDAAFIIKL